MIQRVCDICGNNVTHQFKIKKLKDDYDYEGWLKNTWVEIDICDRCYNSFKNIKKFTCQDALLHRKVRRRDIEH